MADVIQQLRVEVNVSISGRMDMLNNINTALQIPSRVESMTSFQETERQQRRRKIPKHHVRLALVDASVVKSRRKNACHR